MADRTVLDLYRNEVERGYADHITHVTLAERKTISAQASFEAAAAFSAALEEMGVHKGDRVALLCDNRPEWHQVDVAVLALGAVNVPIYPTLAPPQVAYQVANSEAKVVVAEDREQASKLLEAKDSLGEVAHFVQIEGVPLEGFVSWDELVAAHKGGASQDAFWKHASEVKPDQLASIVYTSGTTGVPKGVMLSHRNFTSNVEAVLPRVPLGPNDVALEFLPLCHVFERACGYAYMAVGCRKVYCSPKIITAVLKDIAPTCFAAVPQLFERFRSAVMDKARYAPTLRRKLFFWALDVGCKVSRHRLDGTRPPAGLKMKHALADKLVLSKVRAYMGGRINFVLSGGAPLAASVNEFFHCIGIRVQEGYGLTETSPAIAVNGYRPGENRLGSVGRALDNLDVKLAEDGELLVRGPSVFSGYWKLPEATKEAFDEEGFFRTGDIAKIDEDGFIWITDRKKDIIIPAGGKNVAPQPIENELKKSPYIEHAILIGDKRPYIVALLAPSEEGLRNWAQRHGHGGLTLDELLRLPEARKLFEEAVASVNANLGRFEQIRKFAILPRPLTQESGHLTPTLKVKRSVVEKEFADLIEELYR